MKPQLSCYRYGADRAKGEGLRIGAARRVPRGIKREKWQIENYFDVWMPLIAPSQALVSKYQDHKITFPTFARHYRAEMKKHDSRQVIELLASISFFQPISLGCFCKDPALCHRSVLFQLVLKEAAVKAKGLTRLKVSPQPQEIYRYGSPVCSANEID